MGELYVLPEGWEWKTLEDVFLIARGGSPRPIKDYITDSKDGINWIKIGDATRGDGKYIEFTQQKIKPEGLQKSRLVEEGDFIMSNSMSFGRPYIMKTKGAIHDGWLLMRSKYDAVDKEFFYHLLSSNYMYQQFKAKASGTTVKNLNIGLVKTTNIPLPPLQEQKRIVAKLDSLFAKIDQAIALHQQNIDEAEGFMGSVLNEVFEELEEKYEKKIWNEVLTIKNGKHYKDVIDDNGRYPIYGSGGIMNYANKYICNENSVIIGRKGTINSPIFVKEKFWNIDTAFGIEANQDKLSPMFLFYFTQHFNFLDLNKSTTLPSLAKTRLLDIMMVLPPLSIQQKTVQYLDQLSQKIETLKQVQTQKLESLKALKASLLDKAFRGEI